MRKPRYHHSNAFYHVMLRGNNQQDIFHTDQDREIFYQLLAEVIEQYGCKIHLFCLMSNHVHLVVQVKYISLAKIMHKIATNYSKAYNKARNRNGHLFQNRYQAKLIQNDKYLLELCYYIHHNPLKAKMVANLSKYLWSSHLCYLGIVHIDWLTTSHILNLLKKYVRVEIGSATNKYKNFIAARKEYYEEPHFCELNENGELIIVDSINLQTYQISTNQLDKLDLNQILETVCAQMQVSKDEVVGGVAYDRGTKLVRGLVAYFAHHYAGYYLKDIAYVFNYHPNSLSRLMYRTITAKEHISSMQALLDSLRRNLVKVSLSL